MEQNGSTTRKTVVSKITGIALKHINEVDKDVVFLKSRKREIVQARQVIQYMLKKHTKYSLAVIGEYTGNKDHATVLHSCKTVNDIKDTDRRYRKLIDAIDNEVGMFMSQFNGPLTTRFVLIESPYKGKHPEDRMKNVAYAEKALLHSLTIGETPMASHLIYTRVLDEDKKKERNLGLKTALNWLHIIDCVVVYFDNGITDGMQLSIDKALDMGIDVEYRSINEDTND